MAKVLFLFPGQGSQEIGMARDLFRQSPYFNSLIKYASQISQEDLKSLCLRGPEKKLIQARFLQPLIVAVSLGYLKQVQEKGIEADIVLGHSLGEITALASAGVIDEHQAISISVRRGELMDQAAANCDGSMMAVLSLEYSKIAELIQEQKLEEKVFIANHNSPDQIVVSGDKDGLALLADNIIAAGARAKKLNVAGPWHTPYMKEAYKKFKDWSGDIDFKQPQATLILNATAQSESEPIKIKELISRQLSNPVYFKECLDYCKDKNIDTFLEIGPGRVLSGLVRANGFMQGARIYNVNNLRGLESAALDLCRGLSKG